jgi:hypothetical protein
MTPSDGRPPYLGAMLGVVWMLIYWYLTYPIRNWIPLLPAEPEWVFRADARLAGQELEEDA